MAVKRYFYKTYFQGTAPGTSGLNDQGIWAMIETAETNRVLLTNTFPVVMRTSPTIVGYSSSTGASGYWYNRIANADRQITSISSSDFHIRFNTLSSSQTAGNQIIVLYTASAEL